MSLPTVTFSGILRPKGTTFFRLQAYERVAISLVEVYERVGKSVISVGKKAQKANMHFYSCKNVEKTSGPSRPVGDFAECPPGRPVCYTVLNTPLA